MSESSDETIETIKDTIYRGDWKNKLKRVRDILKLFVFRETSRNKTSKGDQKWIERNEGKIIKEEEDKNYTLIEIMIESSGIQQLNWWYTKNYLSFDKN
jgi:hypothetical protein